MNKRGLPAEVRQRRTKAGFTLIEIIMAIAIAGIIAGIFAVVINSGMGTWFFVKGQKGIMMETRAVMKRMVREVSRTRGNANSNIIAFTSSRYEFKDVDDNTIEYEQNGTDLERNDEVLLQNLVIPGGLEFVYLNSSGNPTTAKSAIRAIRIKLIVEEGENLVRLQSAAGLRNR